MSAIAERIRSVRNQISEASHAAGRDPSEVTLVAVSKTVGAAEVEQAVAAGMLDFGENRAQELAGKQTLFPDARWHFIGTLQTNKVRQVVGRAHLIHSVDSMRLLEVVDRHSREAGVVQRVLLQADVSGEATKHGMGYDALEECVHAACDLPGIQVCGLMTMAPLERPESVRWVFRECAEWLGRLRSLRCPNASLTDLSMGMTNDFGVAVEEGATIVRVGRAIFAR